MRGFVAVARWTPLALALITAVPSRADVKGKFACDLRALDSSQRAAHRALTERLFGAVAERREIDAGYELRIETAKVSLLDLASWVDGERHCCPFLQLVIQQDPWNGALWLRLTGPQGVKPFLRAEMGEPG